MNENCTSDLQVKKSSQNVDTLSKNVTSIDKISVQLLQKGKSIHFGRKSLMEVTNLPRVQAFGVISN